MQAQFDLQELLTDGRHYSERRGRTTYIVDSMTGVTIAVLENLHLPASTITKQVVDGKEVWSDRPNPVLETLSNPLAYSPVIIDQMCARIVNGEALTQICGSMNMPTYAQFCRWRRNQNWIDDAITQARRDRAEALRDKALMAAESADEDNIKEASLRVETYKWAAGVDHERYSPKAKIEATIQAPTQIIVHTGIDRSIGVGAIREVNNGGEESKIGTSAGSLSTQSDNAPRPEPLLAMASPPISKDER